MVIDVKKMWQFRKITCKKINNSHSNNSNHWKRIHKMSFKTLASETTFNYTFNNNVYKNLDHCGNDSSIFHSKIYCSDKSSVRHSLSVFCILESMKETSKSALELWRQKRLDIVTYYSKQSKFLSYLLNEWINCIDAKLMSNKWVSLH